MYFLCDFAQEHRTDHSAIFPRVECSKALVEAGWVSVQHGSVYSLYKVVFA